jgi:hypothetical protein
MCISIKEIIEIIMAITIPTVIGLVFYRSNKAGKKNTENTSEKQYSGGIGARIIQFTTIALLIPCLIILSLEDILKGETIATIIGGLIGYVLSGISNYDNKNK